MKGSIKKMTSAVPATEQSILKETLNPKAFKKIGSKHKKKHGSKSSNKKLKSGDKQDFAQQQLPVPIPVANANINPQPLAINTNTIMPSQPVLSVPSSFASQGQNIQFVAVPVGRMPSFTFTEFRGGGGLQRGPAGGSFRGRRGDMVEEGTSRNHKVRWMLIVWIFLLLTFSKIK